MCISSANAAPSLLLSLLLLLLLLPLSHVSVVPLVAVLSSPSSFPSITMVLVLIVLLSTVFLFGLILSVDGVVSLELVTVTVGVAVLVCRLVIVSV